MQALDTKPHKAIVDLGNRGVDKANPDIDIKHRGKFKGLTGDEKKFTQTTASDRIDHRSLEGGSSDEPGHLKGSRGDSLHAVLCAVGYNIRWLLRMIMKKGISLFLRMLLSTGLGEMGHQLRKFLWVPRSSPDQ